MTPVDAAPAAVSTTAPPSAAPVFRQGRRGLGALYAALGLLMALASLYVAISGYMALSLTRPDRRAFTRQPEQYGLRYESVQFPSRVDALTLDGWLLAASDGVPPAPPVVVVHGKGSDRQREADGRVLEIAADLTRRGHSVLLFDLRGSGRSGGERFTLGAQEVRDVGGAVDFLAARGLATDGVQLLGYSMGAATAVLYAPTDARVKAVVEDSGYADLGDVLDDQVPKASGLPPFFTPGTVFMAWPLMGVNAYAIRPIENMPLLAQRGVPLLVIHGDADTTVPIAHAQRLAAAYGPAVQTLFVPGAGHVASYSVEPSTYLARVGAFLAPR